jgi:hypothetical protein
VNLRGQFKTEQRQSVLVKAERLVTRFLELFGSYLGCNTGSFDVLFLSRLSGSAVAQAVIRRSLTSENRVQS